MFGYLAGCLILLANVYLVMSGALHYCSTADDCAHLHGPVPGACKWGDCNDIVHQCCGGDPQKVGINATGECKKAC